MKLDLGNGRIALVDDDDWVSVRKNYRKDGTVDIVSPCQLSWYLHDDKNGNVEVWSCYRRNGGSKDHRYSMRLHRLIMECPMGMAVDHINGNKLDNRRCNLLLRAGNARPHRPSKTNRSTPYKGVQAARGKYRVKIHRKGVQVTLAYCDTALEGALIYDDAARVEFGEFARLNFPERKHGQVILANKGIRNGLYGAAKKRKVVPNFDGKGHTSIELNNGLVAVIDDSDWRSKRKYYWNSGSVVEVAPCDIVWSARNHHRAKYVLSTQFPGVDRKRVSLHRLIVECPPGYVVDHIDGNPLNNTKANLRVCTRAQNQKNTRKRKKTKHKYKGVVRLGFAKYAKPRYSFAIASDNILHRGGKFRTKLEAAMAYDDKAIELHGEYACLNFPERHRPALAKCH